MGIQPASARCCLWQHCQNYKADRPRPGVLHVGPRGSADPQHAPGGESVRRLAVGQTLKRNVYLQCHTSSFFSSEGSFWEEKHLCGGEMYVKFKNSFQFYFGFIFFNQRQVKLNPLKKIDIWHDPIFMKVFPSLLSVKMHRNMSVPEMLMTVIFES